MHEHTPPKPCEHDLKHCSHCDVVYCEKCKREWKQVVNLPTFWQTQPKPNPWSTQPLWNREDQGNIKRTLGEQWQILCQHS